MLPILLFTDLDDTLFHSHRKIPPTQAHQAMAYLADGSPISYASPQQQTLLTHWQQSATVIPVTARNYDSYRRVDIAFTHHAIINYGAVILNPDGSVDADWLEQSRQAATHSVPQLQALADQLTALPAPLLADLNIRLIGDFDITFYLLLKSRSGNVAHLETAAAFLKPLLQHQEKLHLNSNNLAILPAWLDKAHAVCYVQKYYRQQQGELLTIGMGDSLIDVPFMQCCDFWLTPHTSQINATFA